jgi:hypothetical protein
MGEYTEHDKLSVIAEISQAIGEFIEWLQSHKIQLCGWHEHTTNGQPRYINPPDWDKPYEPAFYQQVVNPDFEETAPTGFYVSRKTVHDLLYEYFNIDRDKLEAEKREMIENIRR